MPAEILFGALPGRYAYSGSRLPANRGISGGHDHDHQFSTWTWRHDEPLGLDPLYRFLQQLPPEIFRAKGILYLAEVPSRSVQLQVVGRRVQLSKGEPWQDGRPGSRILMIGLEGKLQAPTLADGLLACRRDRAAATDNPFTQAVINILRT